jgi:NADH-quinone oxidoreductase subunit H
MEMSFWHGLVAFLKDPLAEIVKGLTYRLVHWGLSPQLVDVLLKLVGAGIACLLGLGLVVLSLWVERKLYARIQDRLGPNRVGPWGIFQTIPDMIKIFTKEYITPDGADKVTYNLAPILAVSGVLLIWGVLPFASTIFGSDINVGVLYIIGVGAIGTLGVILAGWSSNNKYALIGAFRTVSQMISYEVPMVLAMMVPVILGSTMGVNSLVKAQDIWFVLLSPLAAFIFFVSCQAEVARAPFDLLEAESEIVAGYQTEYSGLKFGMFYVGDFLHAITIAALTTALFLGGWRGPWAEKIPVLGLAYFAVKTSVVFFVVVLMRISLPRLRIDQMLNFNWKFLTPLALILVMVTAVVEKAVIHYLPLIHLVPGSTTFLIVRALAHLVANGAIGLGALGLAQSFRKREPPRVGMPRPVAVPPQAKSNLTGS